VFSPLLNGSRNQVSSWCQPMNLGCVLLQEVHNEMHPVAYASRSLTDAAKGYAQIEREALGVLYGLKKMHTYIHSHHVTACSNRPQAPLLGVFPKSSQSIWVGRIALRAQDLMTLSPYMNQGIGILLMILQIASDLCRNWSKVCGGACELCQKGQYIAIHWGDPRG